MMENVGYISLSRQMALRREMDVIANNIANTGTTAFKSQTILFAEYLVEQRGNAPDISFVQDLSVFRNTASGPLVRTGGRLDFAVEGDGYFVVETPEGRRYTRNGRFFLNGDGELATREGHAVLDVLFNRIVFDPAAPGLEITPEGAISNSEGPIATLALVRFANEQSLAAEGNGLYRTDQPVEAVEQPRILLGALEGSNVESILEMTRMINVARSYQTAQRMINDSHDLQRRMIRNLGSVQ